MIGGRTTWLLLGLLIVAGAAYLLVFAWRYGDDPAPPAVGANPRGVPTEALPEQPAPPVGAPKTLPSAPPAPARQ